VNRDEAALLLGVPVNADPEAVRHAWRMWARIAHPDVNGDPAHFAQLEAARRVLLQASPVETSVMASAPRQAWPQVVRRPAHPGALAVTGIGTILCPALASVPAVPYAVAAALSALAAALWTAWAASASLSTGADHGHRIAALALLWLPIAVMQVLISILVGASLVPVLPLLAVPFVAVVALVNPGAGLWRTRVPRG